jgi:asparagine synthase (glutamine-hydrolysing)
MCGILCAIDTVGKFNDLDLEKFKSSLSLIHYRGPDASSYKLFNHDSSVDLYNIFLGHNRLSIIDLSTESNQPLIYKNNYHIIFNGEIYNYLEIRNDLEKEGVEFKTNSDTEVLVALYAHKGIDGFKLLNGMWAFVIYDGLKRKIICSRDRFGEKPFYYFNDSKGRLFMASEIKQLLPFVNATPNIPVLNKYLTHYLLDDNNETFFQGIFKLPQSHNMIVDLKSGKINIEPYWNFTIHDYYSKKDERGLIQEFRDLFFDSVKIRLRSDVKIGNTLSGGLDSSSIAVVAAKMVQNEFHNFSVISSNKKYSEEDHVDSLISNNNLNVKKLLFDKSNPWQDVEDVIWHHDEPILSVSTIAHYQMMRLLKEKTDIVVVLSGQGGDEALAGYNKYFFYALKENLRNKNFKKFLSDGLNILPKFFNEFTLNAARRYSGIGGKEASIFRSIIKQKNDSFNLNAANSFKERQIMDYFHYSVPPLCHYEDRNSMSFSKEIRLPFLDYRLAEFSVNLPLEMKIKNGYTKYILREAITELPKSLRYRKDKKGFSLDERIYFTGVNTQFIQNTFTTSKLEEFGIIDKRALLKSLNNGNPTIWVRDLGRLVFAELWLKKFFA